MSAPALPRRIPGATPIPPRSFPGVSVDDARWSASAAEDCSADSDVCHACNGVHPGGAGGAFCEAAGDVFVPTKPLVTGEPVCFECELEPAVFLLTMVTPTFTGGQLTKSNNIGARCVGQVAAALPRDVDVVITRLRKDPS